ncbi:hypothetical protein BIY22_13375 [Vibrio panuliri]|uniref:Solitary outer membrane autotransporter-like beta-barrel domain-containing protein n=1 Tax=Vibrio panuliri TaxID=1381081 RepID=A0A1Q9H9Y7_9VIBR|nr:Solitary outer membrane autotransporter beta-barrel domain [Vibrio panuliri]OLQ85871.1 hypothetical protein BIY22_13375 [Vibrio panuliri]
MSKFALLLPLCIAVTLPVEARSFNAAKTYVEQAFSAGIVMSDSEALTLGVKSFDPNKLLNINNDQIGSDQSLEYRRDLVGLSLPYTLDLADYGLDQNSQLFLRLSGLSSGQSVEYTPDLEPDYQRETIIGGYAAYRYQYQLSDDWQLIPGIGVHLQYFHNDHDYRTRASELVIKTLLDDVLFNTSAWALSYEPHIKLKYDTDTTWGSWNAFSSAHYFQGVAWGDANEGDLTGPKGWYMSNGIEAFYTVSHWGNSVQSLFSSIKRVDIGGGASGPLTTNHYYEASLGWLMTPPFDSEWIENIGIGLNLNYGSALKGGSIVVYFNQQ